MSITIRLEEIKELGPPPLLCILHDDGTYSLIRNSWPGGRSAGISFDETKRRAIVRALYRHGDLDDHEQEPIFKRLFELLNDERIRLLRHRALMGKLSAAETDRLQCLNGFYVDNYERMTDKGHHEPTAY